jgi:hypothetical protein
MLSFIEMGFYLSLALMICLIFLLMNHLKNRIVVLEKQNEGMMDVIKMIRGNLVSFDHEQKETKKSVYSLAKNISYVSNLVNEIQTLEAPVKEKNITLEVEDLYQHSKQNDNNDEEDEEDDDDEDLAQKQEENKNEELEVVNIELDWQQVNTDIHWPVNDSIEIHKLSSNENLTEIEQMSEAEFKNYFMETHSPIFMNSPETTDLQKLFFMMSMGNGIPMSMPSAVIFQNTSEYEIFPSSSQDPEVEELPDSPMPELIPIDDDDKEESYKIVEEKEDEIQIQTRIDELIDEVITVPVVDVSEDFVFTETEQPEIISIKSEPERISESESIPEPERISESESKEEKEEKEEKTESVDFSKMDLKTLRTLVTTQEKVTHEKAAKMKKGDLIRILSSSV